MEVVSKEVTIQTGAEKMPAHIARPASGGPYPALVVVMQAFGLNDQIKRITNQFASEGFVAIAPNIYFEPPNNVFGYNDLHAACRVMGAVKAAEVVFYPDDDHGFMCGDRPSFHPVHSKEAWSKTIAFFKQNLG